VGLIMADAKLHIQVQRSQLGRVRGLGSAKSGTQHWWAQRVTSVALVPLTIWFVVAMLSQLGDTQAQVAAWIGQPVNTVLLLCLVVATFYHMQLGLQVVLEDYIHDESVRFASVLAVKGVSVLLALACIVAVLKLAFLRFA
jgi:succinate dehydrogenase / fumarate reductase membrane anchor subunit